ncbi:MAG: FtsX-like permease family protein [Chloroflexota bacterium]
MAAVAALLRRIRVERGVAALLFVLVAVTSFAVAAGPRLFNHVADDGLRYEAERGTAIQRNLQFTFVGSLPSRRDDPFGRIAARGESLRARLPESIQALISEGRFVVDAPRFGLADPPRFTTFVTLRQQDGLDAQTELSEGRWPVRFEPAPGTDADAPSRFEVALSDATADAIGVEVGDTLAANVDPNDPLLRNIFPRPTTAVEVDVVGRFSVRDPAAPHWYDDRGLGETVIGGTDDSPIAFATGVFAPDAYVDVLALGLPLRYRWRLFVDIDRLDAGQLDVLSADLRRVAAANNTTGALRAGSTQFRSGLLDILERYRGQRSTSVAALSVAALGPLAVAAGAVGLIGMLIVRRRRPGLALARGRGASAGQLLATQLWEGLLVTVPAAVVGLLAATALISSRPSELSSTGAVLVALGATILLLGATWPLARRARRDLERDDPPIFRLAPRRLVFESLIIGLSLAAAWLLRERGVASGGQAGASRGFDPFLAASPLLIGLSVGLLTIRLYPIPVRALGWLSARRRDLVPVLGLRNLGRHPTSGYLPVLILMLTVAIGTFSSVVAVSIERSQTEVSWREIGADYRIESSARSGLDPGLTPHGLPGVQEVAAGHVEPDAPLSTGPGRRFSILVAAVETRAYNSVLAGSPVETNVAAFLGAPPTGPDAGRPEAPIPVVLSTRLPAGTAQIPLGSIVEITIRGRPMTFQVSGRRDTFPGIAPLEPFVIVPFESVAAGWSGTPFQPNVFLIRAPAASDVSIRGLLPAEPGGPVLVSRYQRYAQMHDAPLVAAVTNGFVLALAVALAYAALAVVAVVVLHAQRRSREVAFLRTLGMTDRQVAGLTVVEQGLPVILALAVGVGLGLGLAWLLEPGIELDAFSSPGALVTLQVDWPSVAVIAASIVGVVVLAVALSSWFARRLDLGHALRIGEE